MNNTNPFQFKYPDDILPQDVIDLFVPVFGEYYNVPITGHTFINGARGSGKSMMFRYMKPDCQVLVDEHSNKLETPRPITKLDYFGIYVPIKKGHLNKQDINLNDKHGEALLNEHFMVIHFSLCIFKELSEANFNDNPENRNSLIEFNNSVFNKFLKFAGYKTTKDLNNGLSIHQIFCEIINTLRSILSEFQQEYIKKLIGAPGPVPYNGTLLLYTEFLFEVLKAFRMLPFMPTKPIYLLIDDADELTIVQRKILNSWVSLRTTNEVSLKISTQLKYKVFGTINGSRIDTPHDYSEVNMNDIYTTKKDIYYSRVKQIVEKRLEKHQYDVTDPEQFFPPDLDQQKKIEKIKKKYIDEKINEGLTKQQAYDYAYRYAEPDFIKELKGNRYTYSYAGFKQLVNISSGIIREFIDFASEMYVAQIAKGANEKINSIDPMIQDREIKSYSRKKMESEFDKFRDEAENKSDMDKLRNLILGMGGLFQKIIISDASERRVFSVALNDEPDEELRKILDLGVQHGYIQKSMIGNKHGTGKSRLYILNRILSPHFGLDPSSFAGYKFMDSEVLKKSLTDPLGFIKSLIPKIAGAINDNQISLFDESNN
ncbi:hypothetical protein SDC9_55210 [bioreactor metagenome]|uniref:Uncharacterized protein n=1 Tax=bioreactor metagenome TaxID=1076179 RepID=A0A644X433_9ZZZZ